MKNINLMSILPRKRFYDWKAGKTFKECFDRLLPPMKAYSAGRICVLNITAHLRRGQYYRQYVETLCSYREICASIPNGEIQGNGTLFPAQVIFKHWLKSRIRGILIDNREIQLRLG